MRIPFTALTLLAGLAAAAAAAPPSPSAAHASSTRGDAAPARDAPPVPDPSFRVFVPPEPLGPPGPPTPSTSPCRSAADADARHEQRRERQALDLALRERGGMLLAVEVVRRDLTGAIGTLVRGDEGQRWMIVGAGADSCTSTPPTVAIDAQGEVYEVLPRAVPARKVRVRLCAPTACGCGVPGEPVKYVVEVPEGARLGPPRKERFPIDVQVVLEATDERGRPVPCTPRP